MKISEITYLTEAPKEYAAGIRACANVAELLDYLRREWAELCPDAIAQAEGLPADEDLKKLWSRAKRKSGSHAELLATEKKCGAIVAPEELLWATITAVEFNVPWGLAYLRRKEVGA